MATAFLPIALVAYLVGVFLAGLSLIYHSEAARGGASSLFVVAWLAHVGAVLQQGRLTGQFPLSNVAEYLLLLGLAVMTLHLVIWFVWRVHAAGLLLPPLVALAGFIAMTLLSADATPRAGRPEGLFLFHTTVSTLGMATLCVALAMSLIFLIQDRALKSHRTMRVLERLPSLDRCDQIGFQALVIGFVLLTVGIVTGLIVNASVHDRIWVPGAKQLFPMLAWAVFAVVLAGRYRAGLRGRTSAYWTITGVTLGLLSVVGMTL